MSGRDDIPGDPQKDLEKFRRMRRQDNSRSAGGWLEAILGLAAAIVAAAWFVTMWLWVPDPIDGPTWMGLGALGMSVTGLPAAIIYYGRRGGARVAKQLIQEVIR